MTGVIANRYRIDREIGRGGMATVYQAHDLRHDAPVAIKVLHAEMVPLVGNTRFIREIQIIARLQHPNILALLDSGEHDGRPYYVMPFVEGETLEQRIEREGPLPIADAVDIAAQVADALTHAHELGFVHRDVKPSNILLSRSRALLSDFGVAYAVDSAGGERLTETGSAIGTTLYMSPEQGLGDKLDGRSDIYSLGCVLYEMLTGGPPFTGPRRSVIARHAADTVPGLRTVRHTVSPAIEAAVLKALAKLPADRHRDAAQFAQALRQAETTDSLPVPGRWSRGARVALGTAAVLAIAFLAWRSSATDVPALDINRVMVFPLVVPDNFPSRSIGEEVATLIGHALDGVGPLRWIDGWQLLDPASRDNIRLLEDDAMRALARAAGCAYFLTGRLVVAGDSASVFLELSKTQGADAPSRGDAGGAVDEAWRVGLRAVNQVLPDLVPGANRNLAAEWRDRQPAAVASFLHGESAFRRARFHDAFTHYDNAVRVDPAFALAAIRGAQAATWSHRHDDAATLIDVATRHDLPARYSAFARGYRHYLAGRADSAVTEFRAAIDVDPEMIPAWLQLGETHVHLLPTAANMDSIAEDAFQHALALDSSSVDPLFHLIEIQLRHGQLRQATPLVERFLSAQPDSSLRQKVEVLHACASDGARNVNWTRYAAVMPLAALTAADTYAAGGAGSLAGHGVDDNLQQRFACAAAGYQAVIDGDTANTGEASSRRFFALVGLQGLLVSQGRERDAIRLIDGFVERWGEGSSLHLFAAPFHASFEGRAREVARVDSAAYGADFTAMPYNKRLWLTGVWQATQRNLPVADAIASELAERALRSGNRRDSVMSASLNAHLALARGDTTQALLGFESLLSRPASSDQTKWDEADALGGERLTLARLLHATGQHERAIDVANVLDSGWPAFFPILLRPSLELRERAAAALGDALRETYFNERLSSLRSDSVPGGG